jgi:hypothetical protein
MASIPTPDQEPQDAADAYVGMDAEEAGRLAGERGWQTVRTLPPGAIITLEYRVGRLNFEVDQGRVVRCWKG